MNEKVITPERVIHFYRVLKTGQRVRIRMELDASNTVISETVASDAHNRTPDSAAPSLRVFDPQAEPQLRHRQSAHLEHLKARGMDFVVTPDGAIDLTYVPPLEQAFHHFFAENVPCFFPECEMMKQQWQDFKKENGVVDDSCADCTLGALMMQFRPRVEPYLRKIIHEKPDIFRGIQIGSRHRAVS